VSGRALLSATGSLAMFGALFCATECWMHYGRATSLVQEVRQVSVFHPPVHLGPQQAALLQATELQTVRTVLVGEETAMRDYGIGSLVLFVAGSLAAELSVCAELLTESQRPPSPGQTEL
jgi:hypothetical protein